MTLRNFHSLGLSKKEQSRTCRGIWFGETHYHRILQSKIRMPML